MAQELITLNGKEYEMAYTAAKIDFPAYDKLKARVDVINTEYSQYAVTPKNFKEAKETRAQLNHLKQDLNKRKISIVKEVNKPVNDFQTKFKVLLDGIGDASDHISQQIKAYEERIRRDREEQNDKHIAEWCKEAGVDPEAIERQPQWSNKTFSYATFEKEVKQQIAYLLEQKRQFAENVKVVTARAKDLGLPYQHWVELLNNSPLSDVLTEMDHYADEVKRAVEREHSEQKRQNNVTNQGGKAVNLETGEIKGKYYTAMLTTKTDKIKIGGSEEQFKRLFKILEEEGFKVERCK